MRSTLAIFALILSAAAAPAQQAAPRLSVVGVGKATADPDIAVTQIAVGARAAEAAAAFAAASKATRTALGVIAVAGVESDDVQTTGLSLAPVYAGGGDQPLRIEGYAARQNLSVTVRSLDRLGPLLDALTAGGAVDVEGISFDIADRGPLTEAARRAAVADAGRAAALLAEAAGVTLGRPVAISMRGEGGFPSPVMRAAAMDAAPVAPGALTISATVSIDYAIQ